MNSDDNNKTLDKKANTQNKKPARREFPLNITKIGEYSLRLIFFSYTFKLFLVTLLFCLLQFYFKFAFNS